MQKAKNTIQLRGRYQAKIRIPKSIQKLYGGKEFYQKSLKTADPKVAEKEVRAILAVMDAQFEQHKAEQVWQALARNLCADQRALLEAAGGLSDLLKHFERGKIAFKFIEAGAPVDDGELHPAELQIEVAEHQAASEVVGAQTNRDGRVLRQIGQEVELVGDVFSLCDVIEKWAPTVDPQTFDATRYYVRRSTVLNGEFAVADLTKAHLRDFAEAIKGLPTVVSAKLPNDRAVKDLSFSKIVAWAKKNDKEKLSGRTRDKYMSIMMRLLGFAAEQDYRQGNPWADYKIPRKKQKHSEKAKADRRPFTAAEVRRVLDYVSSSNEPQYAKTKIDYRGRGSRYTMAPDYRKPASYPINRPAALRGSGPRGKSGAYYVRKNLPANPYVEGYMGL